MKYGRILGGMILAGLIALSVPSAWSEERSSTVPPGGGSSLSMTKYYVAPLGSVGNFPGKVVRLSCDANETSKPAACGRTDHGLIVEGDDLIHPLLPGTEEMRSELSSAELQGSEVTVHGKYYPSTGEIVVNRIDPAACRITTDC